MVIDVLVEVNINKSNKTFSYLVPESYQKDIKIGKRVLVPFGKHTFEGFVLNIKNSTDLALKPIIK